MMAEKMQLQWRSNLINKKNFPKTKNLVNLKSIIKVKPLARTVCAKFPFISPKCKLKFYSSQGFFKSVVEMVTILSTQIARLILNRHRQGMPFHYKTNSKTVSRLLIYLLLSTINNWFLVVKRHACSLLLLFATFPF